MPGAARLPTAGRRGAVRRAVHWLALFTLAASLVANRYWEMAGTQRFMAANAFYEHLGLAGGFLLVAWHDLAHKEMRWPSAAQA